MDISLRNGWAFALILIFALHEACVRAQDGTTPKPNCDSPDLNTTLSLPSFHGFKPATPIEKIGDDFVIQNEVIENWGNWQGWKQCPPGMYAVGFQTYALSPGGVMAGTFYFNFLCRTPGGNEGGPIIEDSAPGHSKPSGSGRSSFTCSSVIVGFTLDMQPSRRSKKTGTHQINGTCSTSIKQRLEHISGRSRANYLWTESANCDIYQAMCGFQAQMGSYEGTYQEKALNNLRIKCCHVPDPLKDCVPKEDLIFVQTCDNSAGSEDLQCDYERKIGLSFDYEEKEKNKMIFYSSIGYDLMSIKDKMVEKISSKLLADQFTLGRWDKLGCDARSPESSSSATLTVKPRKSVKLYQIVGRCGYFLVRTDRFYESRGG